MPHLDEEAYLRERVNPQLDWSSRASRRNKGGFVRSRLISILLGALITVLSPYAGQTDGLRRWIPLTLQLAGAGVAVSGSLLALNRNQENWVRYRSLEEALKREKMLFLTGSTELYSDSDAFSRFVERAEAIMQQEQSSWFQLASNKEGNTRVPPSKPDGNPERLNPAPSALQPGPGKATGADPG